MRREDALRGAFWDALKPVKLTWTVYEGLVVITDEKGRTAFDGRSLGGIREGDLKKNHGLWEKLRRPVALKVLKEPQVDAAIVRRLQREAVITAQLKHPHIVPIYEVGEATDGSGQRIHYIAMELVNGRTLADRMAERKTSVRELVRMLEEVARAVDYVHGEGVIHRDLKPSNVLVEKDGRVLLTDFGLARAEMFGSRLTETNEWMGTPAYMAPEQVRGKARDADERTDVYALGVILYEILTGRVPFRGETPGKLYERVMKEEPERPSRVRRETSRELEAVCLKAMEKDPARRYPMAREFAEELRRYEEGKGVLARPVSAWRRLARRARRSRGFWFAASILLAAISATGIALGVSYVRNKRAVAAERERGWKREVAARQLGALWFRIVECKRERRHRMVSAEDGRRRLEEAVAAVGDYIREWPDDPQGYSVRARGKIYLGDLAGAERDVDLALSRDRSFRLGWRLLGMIKVGEYEEVAYLPLGSTCREDEFRMSALLAEARDAFDRGNGSAEESALARAREDETLDRSVAILRLSFVEQDAAGGRELASASWEALHAEEYARFMGDLATSIDEKIEWYTRAIEQARGYAEAYLDRGIAKRVKGDLDGAIADCGTAIDLRKDYAKAYFDRGLARRAKGDHDGAIADFDRAIEIKNDFALAYTDRGGEKLQKDDLDGAFADAARAAELKPTFAGAWSNLAALLAVKGDYERAIVHFTRAIELDGNLAMAYSGRGGAYYGLGKYPEAIEDYSRAIDLRRDFYDAYRGRGLAKGRSGDLKGAIEDLRRALKCAPADWSERGKTETVLRETEELLRRN